MIGKPVVFNLFYNSIISDAICNTLGYTSGTFSIHEFPDNEILVKVETLVKNKNVIFVVDLDHPNNKIAPLIFAAETIKELGANKIGVIAPYLPYMRQDKQFHLGEGITSKYFAKLLSTYFDWLITIDPHLHRWHSLKDIFTIPTTSLHATKNIADWINKHVTSPVIIGPDKESEQWVAGIAKISHAPYLIAEKSRVSDTLVSATIPQLKLYPNHTPILIDDIISTGATMLETIKHIKSFGTKSIICIGIHAIFANDAYQALLKTGVTDILTCNTIVHPTNKIDISNLIIDALKTSNHFC